MRAIIPPALCCVLISISGCSVGTPTIDSSSDEALDGSMQRIAASLPAEGKKEFAEDCLTLSGPRFLRSAFGAAARGKKDSPRRSDLFHPLHGMNAAEVHAKAIRARAEMDREDAARREAVGLAKKPEAIAALAVAQMRKSAAVSFGTAEAKQAVIEAGPSSVKEFGESAWDVSGTYEGPDKDGKPFKARWVARIEWRFDSLQCMQVTLGDKPNPRAADDPSPAPEPAPPVVARGPGIVEAPPAPAELAPKAEAEKTARAPRVGSAMDAKVEWDRKLVEVYPAARKAIAAARNRGAQANSSVRKQSIKRQVDAATAKLCKDYSIAPADFDRFMAEGEALEKAARKKAISPTK